MRRIQKQFSFHDSDIIAMDKTVVWNDMVSNTTVKIICSEEVPAKLTGYNKVRIFVFLTGKAVGSKCKPFIVFRGTERESKFLNKEFKRESLVATSTNGWMNEELTLRWCSDVLGKFSLPKRLLVWNSYEAHLADDVKEMITNSKVVTMPYGCTRNVQVPDVV